MLIAELMMRNQGITQTDVANIGGVNRVSINRVLRGHVKPYPKYKKAFCTALDWHGNPDYLFRNIDVKDAKEVEE